MPLAATADTSVARRLATLVAGLLLVAPGVALTIRGEVGVAPYDVLTTGMAATFGIGVGVAAMILPAVFSALAWALGRRPGPGTLISIVALGPILGAVLAVVPEQTALPTRAALFVAGFLVICAGITLVVVAEIGPGPAEILMLAVHDKGVELARARTAIELVCVALGWAAGGQIGIGTLVVALTIGPILRWMLHVAGYSTARAAEASDIGAPAA